MDAATMPEAGEADRAWLPVETRLPRRSAGRGACGLTAPPWKFGVKEIQTAGKDGQSGLLDAGLCT